MSIRIGLLGYGNLSRGVESAILQNADMDLVAVFTRRNPDTVKPKSGVPVFEVSELENYKNKIDVLVLGGGSATDLPAQTPEYVKYFNVVDSFENVDKAAKAAGKVGIISVGWDPGMFSLLRMISTSVLPEGENYTFWGKGVSQGHSDAIRRIKGVKDARQYTIPVEEAVNRVRKGENPTLSTREKHTRECFVVVEEGADKTAIESEIVNMPNYFSDYNTTVHFISAEEMERDHKGLPHGGFVLRSGVTGFNKENKHIIEYSLKLDSNPEFTGSVIAAYARAAYRLSKEGISGCKTVFDIAPAYISPLSGEELRKSML